MHTHTHTYTHTHTHTHTHTTHTQYTNIHAVNNPVINLNTAALSMQAGALGKPVDVLFNSSNFVSVLPPGLDLTTSKAFQVMPYKSILLLLSVLVTKLA